MQITQNDLILTKGNRRFQLEQSDKAITPNKPVQYCTGTNKLTPLTNAVSSLTAGGGYDYNSIDGKERNKGGVKFVYLCPILPVVG